MCIFCKIVKGEIPCEKVYEDGKILIIKDINPQAKLHYLLIPKEHYSDMGELSSNNPESTAYCFSKIAALSEKLGLSNGYRLITNKGIDGCQSVQHIHIHILGGEKLAERMG